jgi:hypothetical protein
VGWYSGDYCEPKHGNENVIKFERKKRGVSYEITPPFLTENLVLTTTILE